MNKEKTEFLKLIGLDINTRYVLQTPIKRLKNKNPHDALVEIGIRILKSGRIYYQHLVDEEEKEQKKKDTLFKWKNRYIGNCKPVFKEPQNLIGYIPDVIGFSWLMSVVLECKTSIQDFRNEKKKTKPKAGDIFCFLAHKGIIPTKELNEYEGLLEITQQGMIEQTKTPVIQKTPNKRCERAILLSILRGKNINAHT